MLPRENLEKNGVVSLSNSDLLAVILGFGSRKENVLSMSKKVAKEYGVEALASLSDYKKLSEVASIPKFKSMQIISAIELGRRLFREEIQSRPQLNAASKVFYRYSHMGRKGREEVRALYMNSRQILLAEELISIGSVNFVNVQIRDILKPAFEFDAVGILIIHNHPSGDANPSGEDILFTERLKKYFGFFWKSR